MNIIETPIAGLFVVEPKVWNDKRGYFYESYNTKLFAEAGINVTFVQDNQSCSQKGTLRGLHAQKAPYAQGKLVRVIQGRVQDIAVDIRKDSATYGQYFSLELSGENHRQLWIPPGFLHGFLTLENDTIFTYKVSNYYDKASEIGVMYNDADLNIKWGEGELSTDQFILSEKDLALPAFKDFTAPY